MCQSITVDSEDGSYEFIEPTPTDIRWFKNSEKLASTHSSGGKYAMTAVAVKGNRIFSSGYNYYPNRRGGETKDELYHGLGAHAELMCLTSGDVNRCILYIAGVSPSGSLVSSRPCPRCWQLIRNSRVKKIVYAQNGTVKAIKVRDMKHRQIRALA